MRLPRIAILLCLTAAAVTTGCGGGSSSSKADITLQADSFAASTITVAAGSTVTVANPSSMTHDVVATGGSGSVKTAVITPGGHGSFVAPTALGTYRLTCDYHPDMRATLIVH